MTESHTKRRTTWVLTDGKMGMVSQAMGLAEAVGFDIVEKTVRPAAPWKWLPTGLWPSGVSGVASDADIIDGGAEYSHYQYRGDGETSPTEEIWFGRAGVLFGLTDDWEAGALFVPIQISPDFGFNSILAYGTRGFRFENFDTGIRMSFKTPKVSFIIPRHTRIVMNVGSA